MTLNITTFSITELIITIKDLLISINDTSHLSVIMLSVVMLGVVNAVVFI